MSAAWLAHLSTAQDIVNNHANLVLLGLHVLRFWHCTIGPVTHRAQSTPATIIQWLMVTYWPIWQPTKSGHARSGTTKLISLVLLLLLLSIFAAWCYAQAWCLSVCLSVTFLDSVKMSIRIVKKFLPSGSHTVSVFPHQTSWQYFDSIECRWGRQKSQLWDNNSAPSHAVNRSAASAICLAATDHGELMTLVVGKRQSLLMEGDDRRWRVDDTSRW